MNKAGNIAFLLPDQPLYIIILSRPNKNGYVFQKKMLLVKTSFFYVFMPYICDP